MIPMAGQMRSASGELLGVWVDFLDYTGTKYTLTNPVERDPARS